MVGFGYDSHKLVEGKYLIIGGINIESLYGAISHSDGDVLLHALCDSLLGASGLGDIGEHFPDNDEKYKNSDSKDFVLKIVEMLEQRNYTIVNIDTTIILEAPKLKQYKESIRNNIAVLCNIDVSKINIKAKTNEQMGFVGRNEGIAAICVCQIEPK